MYIVERLNNGIPTGRYYKKDTYNSIILVEREKARVFRNHSGILNCLGNMVRLEIPKKINKWRTQRVKRVLDETKWKIHEISFHDVE